MDLNYLKKIVKLLEQSSVDEIEIEEEGTKIRIARNQHSLGSNGLLMHGQQPVYMTPAQQAPAPAPAAPAPAPEAPPVPVKIEATYHEIKSPIVGTFYRSPAPDADAYVEIGQTVQTGTVLCIIEAMKLMNEIECDIGGRVVKVCVENGQPVEYNQPLFLIEPL